MKKFFVLALALLLLFVFCACARPGVNSSLEKLNEAYNGKSNSDIHKALGEPDGCLSGLWGDIYLRSENEIVIFYYNSEGLIETIIITERQVTGNE